MLTQELASKHPDNTIIIQYDIKGKEYRIVHGDLDKIQGDNVRWQLFGHGSGGRIGRTNNLLAMNTSNEVAMGMLEIKERLKLINPKHIVIASCNLANENYVGYFALDFSRRIWKSGINASVKAFNENIYISHHGQKEATSRVFELHNILGVKDNDHRVTYSKDIEGNILFNDKMVLGVLIKNIAQKYISIPRAISDFPDLLEKEFSQQGKISPELIENATKDLDTSEKFGFFLDKKYKGEIPKEESFADWVKREANSGSFDELLAKDFLLNIEKNESRQVADIIENTDLTQPKLSDHQDSYLERSLDKLTSKAVVLLDALADGSISVTDLSKNTKNWQGIDITHPDDPLLSREILKAVSEPDSYQNIRSDLLELQKISAKNTDLLAVPTTDILSPSRILDENHVDKNLSLMKTAGDDQVKDINPHRLSANGFQSFGQKVGAGAQTIGMLTLFISTATMTKRLLAPDITDEERVAITRQLAISWSSTVVDLGTDLMQPTFDKLQGYFNKKLLSTTHTGAGRAGYKMAAKSAKFAGAGLNAGAAGFEIYEAIDNFSKAERETNRDLKTDYIVNGSLSTIGAAVSTATAIALFMGTSVAGPIGIAIGAAIMLAGMIYNAVRQVEYIKREIELNGWEEFKTGIRLAFGAEPEEYIKQRLEKKSKEELSAYITQQVNDTFEQRIKPLGYNHYAYVNEPVDLTPVKKYVYIYKVDTYFIGTEQQYYQEHYKNGYITDSTLDLSYSRNYSVKSEYRYGAMRYSRRPLSENELNRWKESVNVDDYKIIELEVTDLNNKDEQDNAIIFNRDLFDCYNTIGSARDIWLGRESSTKVILASGKEYNDLSTHFNSGGGDDLIFAHADHRNSFDVSQGHKTFVGGDKEDTFYLMGDVEASVHRPASILDGQGGSDTIIAMGVRFSADGYDINLAKGSVKYINDKLRLATIYNIENAYGQADTNDKLMGDDNVNYLNGGGGIGYDQLEGQGGNDILVLQRGVAVGGKGSDIYIISPKVTSGIDVTIMDDGLDEVSTIQLPYTAGQIRNILLNGSDIDISLGEEYHESGKIRLKGVYQLNKKGDKKILAHNYIIQTADNLILLPEWPQTLDIAENEPPSSLKMIAHYNPMVEYLTQAENKQSEPPIVTVYKRGSRGDTITVNDKTSTLPTFIRASLNSSQLIKHKFFGDGAGYHFENLGPGDSVVANGGDNTFYISQLSLSEGSDSNTLIIDCRLLINQNREDNRVNLVLGDITGYELRVTENSLGDLSLTHRDKPNAFLNIALNCPDDLKYKDSKRLISFVDKNHNTFSIENRGGGYEIYPDSPVIVNPTALGDNIILPEGYRLLNSTLDLMAGDDSISDLSCIGHNIDGGLGDDIIYAKGGDNRLIGGEGSDQLFSGSGSDYLVGGDGQDILCAGSGIDKMEGGEGDDTYVIELEVGKTTIRDNHGKNRVIFKDIDYRKLWFKKQNNNLLVRILGVEKEVVIEGDSSGHNILAGFVLQTNDHKIEGEELALLVDNMMHIPDVIRDGSKEPASQISNDVLQQAWKNIIAA
ncbi:C80 family cysteine peptidase [Yersinia bercovieri]|uniref:C80 family cysteine peptidase n=1 Tax=Yersinia bercovieri TaxID=634 RepID=UPI0021BD5FB8|nr:C80 family cysteine peptidase [Yersinia bercovieri]